MSKFELVALALGRRKSAGKQKQTMQSHKLIFLSAAAAAAAAAASLFTFAEREMNMSVDIGGVCDDA